MYLVETRYLLLKVQGNHPTQWLTENKSADDSMKVGTKSKSQSEWTDLVETCEKLSSQQALGSEEYINEFSKMTQDNQLYC